MPSSLRAFPKVLDFGVARAIDSDIQTTTLQTDLGQLVGTIPYMSPEQIVGDPHDLDTRSDVYALGVVLFELLSGRLPHDFKQKMIHEAVRMVREEEPIRLSSINKVFRGDIDTLVSKALEKDKTRRYASASELAADIRRYLTDEPLVARPASPAYQFRKFARRNRALVAGSVAVFLTLFVGIVAFWWQVKVARAERDDAQRHSGNTQGTIEFLDRMLTGSGSDRLPREATLTEILRQAGEGLESGSLRDKPEVELAVRGILAKTHTKMTMHSAAEAHLRAIYSIYQNRMHEKTRERAEAANDLANCLSEAGRPDEAEPYYEETWSFVESNFEPASEEAMTVLTNLGTSLLHQRKFDEALAHFTEAHERVRLNHGEDAARLSTPAYWIAHAKLRRNASERDLEEAAEYFLERIKNQEPDSADIAWSQMYLAWVRTRQGSLGEAETHIARSLEIHRSKSPSHPGVPHALAQLAIVKRRQALNDKAESLLLESLSLLEDRGRDLGEDIVFSAALLADLHLHNGNDQKAHELLAGTVQSLLNEPGIVEDDVRSWIRRINLDPQDHISSEVANWLLESLGNDEEEGLAVK